MAHIALVIILLLSTFANASTVFDMSEHSGFIRDSNGNFSRVSPNGSVRSLTSNTALAIVEKPYIQTSKGPLQATLNRTASVDVSRLGKAVSTFAQRVGPLGMALAAADLVCSLSTICNVNGTFTTSGNPAAANYPATTTKFYYWAPAFPVDTNAPTPELACTKLGAKYSATTSYNSGTNMCTGPGINSSISNAGNCATWYTYNGTQCVLDASVQAHVATPTDWTAKESTLNNSGFTPHLNDAGEDIPITTPVLTGSPVTLPMGSVTKTLKDGSGTVTGSETDTTSLSITDGATNATPNVINITETTIHNVYNNSNVLQSSTTTTTDPQQPAKDSKVDPLEIKFDTVNDTPLTEKVVTSPFTTTSWGGGECPADISMNLTRGNFSIDSQPFCDFAIALKPILLLVAALAGAYIVITSSRPTT